MFQISVPSLKCMRGYRILLVAGTILFIWNLYFIVCSLDKRKTVTISSSPKFQNLLNDWDSNDGVKNGRDFSAGYSSPAIHRCNLTSQLGLKTLKRVKTDLCYDTITDVLCKLEDGNFHAHRLPRACPLQDLVNAGKYLGCFADGPSPDRLLTGSSFKFPENNSPRECIDVCLKLGFQTAGVKYKEECSCGWLYSVNVGEKLADSQCHRYSCPADPTATCGGFKAIAVYNTGLGGKYHQTTSYVPVTGKNSEGKNLEYDGDNFRVKRNRFATIWGGASLLDMILDSIKDLMKIWPKPSWQFLLNLSEADFPILSIEELEALLAENRGLNFLRSHGNNTKKFISKQGLDRLFVECDYRMWRVGERSLPKGIRIDGGSDWVGLDREFAEYAATSKDNIVNQLRQLFQYTLLPAESFFHTLSANTEFCTKVINSNLKLTNWRRKQGCKGIIHKLRDTI